MILLDTNIVAGLFDPTGSSNESRFNEPLSKLLENTKDKFTVAPTPVCFELMKYAPVWYDFVTKSDLACFKYWKYSITNEIKIIAAKYLLKINPNKNPDKGTPGEKQKISDVDALIAAYSFRHMSDIITCNQMDFAFKYFSVINVGVALNVQRNSRDTIYLLRPNQRWMQMVDYVPTAVELDDLI